MNTCKVSRLKKFEIWDYYSPLDNQLKCIDASDTPFVKYPNNVPCFEANLYISNKIKNNASRRVKGGTLRTYAHQIIHLINFCCKQNIRFSQLTDNIFTLFVRGLQAERDEFSRFVRTNTHVIAIVRQCIDFLIFINGCHDLKNFIGKGKENAIRVFEKAYKIKIEGSKHVREVISVNHASMPSKDVIKKRQPISADAADALWEAIGTQDNVLVQRDTALYQMLDQTGGRRTEIAWLKVIDIEKALNSSNEYPLLKMITLKRKDHQTHRVLPVTRVLLEEIKSYINKARKRVIKNTIGPNNDHGYLFVSTTTGKPLEPDTITSIISKWRKISGIEDQAFAHLFRHSYITNKLKDMILQHKEINSKDKFREHLLNTERFKMQLQQWTGHTQLYSLDIYIDLVFNELAQTNKTYSAVALKDSVKLIKKGMARLDEQLEHGEITHTEYVMRIKAIISAFEQDIDASQNVQ